MPKNKIFQNDDWIDGTWIRTYTGKKVYPLNPKINQISIIDIAHSLSLICRYVGHVSDHYSVSQHSCIISNYLKYDIILSKWGLLHDAPEAYICDIPRPIKPHFPGYAEIETRHEKLIAQKFDLPYPIPPKVKEIDMRILKTELQTRFVHHPKLHIDIQNLKKLDVDIPVISPKKAEAQFLQRYIELFGPISDDQFANKDI